MLQKAALPRQTHAAVVCLQFGNFICLECWTYPAGPGFLLVLCTAVVEGRHNIYVVVTAVCCKQPSNRKGDGTPRSGAVNCALRERGDWA